MLTLRLQGTGQEAQFSPRKVVMAGFTGRDQAAVQKHIEELREHGVPAPKRVPTFYPVIVDRLTTAENIEVLGHKTSGEAEFVLLFKGDEIYVAVGSDHTDRELEEETIVKSKQMCAKVISRDVWRYEDLKERWDELLLRSWVGKEGRETLYQEGRLVRMMTPETLLAITKERIEGELDGLALYSGTLPMLTGEFVYSGYFEAELLDEKTGEALRCAYRVSPMDWFVYED
ncbi:MAG: DUF2848 domain-containing protein [Chloroflexi bacterium]|nr:DUF2848 domain-containing protein [Chloroflexota bacterium]MDA8187292.1 DUF2848 family protein [Dehalococcoidales bacterium]